MFNIVPTQSTVKSKVPGILALLTTLAGLISSPALLGLIPNKYAAIIIAFGALLQAVTKAINHTEGQ